MTADTEAPQSTCAWCGHALTPAEEVCPGCGNRNPVFSRRARAAAQVAERQAARGEPAGGEGRSSEGIRSALGEGCLDGCLEMIGSALFGVLVILGAAAGIVRWRTGRRPRAGD